MKAYLASLGLLVAMIAGGVVGYGFPSVVPYLQPLGEAFLNLLLTCVVPLVFFCVSASMTKFQSRASLEKTFLKAGAVFLGLGLLAALYMLSVVLLWPDLHPVAVPALPAPPVASLNLLGHVASLVSVPQFALLWSNEHLLALLVFALLVGVSARQSTVFMTFLQAGETTFLQVFQFLMRLAPLGFFAYFAYMVHTLGTQFAAQYLHLAIVYYVAAAVYFVVGFSLYVFLAGGRKTLALYWQHLLLPAVTALATCSSAASIPANYAALAKMRVPKTLAEMLIPLGTVLHKQGSIMGGVIKIVFLYQVFHLPLTGLVVLSSVIAVSLLVGSVMGAIPSGGLLGELLILHVYGFDSHALLMIATISLIIDAPATLLNVVGNTVALVIVGSESGSRSYKPRLPAA